MTANGAFFLSRNFGQRNKRAFRNALADLDFSEIYSASLALWGEFTSDRWIPRTKGQ